MSLLNPNNVFTGTMHPDYSDVTLGGPPMMQGAPYANPDPALHALNVVRALKLEDFIRFRNCLNALLENEEMA